MNTFKLVFKQMLRQHKFSLGITVVLLILNLAEQKWLTSAVVAFLFIAEFRMAAQELLLNQYRGGSHE